MEMLTRIFYSINEFFGFKSNSRKRYSQSPTPAAKRPKMSERGNHWEEQSGEIKEIFPRVYETTPRSSQKPANLEITGYNFKNASNNISGNFCFHKNKLPKNVPNDRSLIPDTSAHNHIESTRKNMAPRKKDFKHFDFDKCIRMGEKERYKTLIEQASHFPPLSYKKYGLSSSKDLSINHKSILNDNTNKFSWNKSNSAMTNNFGAYDKFMKDAYDIKNHTANRSTVTNKPTFNAKMLKEKNTGINYEKSIATNSGITLPVNKDKLKKCMKDREKYRNNCLQSLHSCRYYSPPHSPPSTIVLTDSSSNNSETNESPSSPSTFTSTLSPMSFPHYKSPKSTSPLSSFQLSNGFLDERYQKSLQLLEEVTNGFKTTKSNVIHNRSSFWNGFSNKTVTQNDKDSSFRKPSGTTSSYSHQRNNYKDNNDLIIVSDEENNINTANKKAPNDLSIDLTQSDYDDVAYSRYNNKRDFLKKYEEEISTSPYSSFNFARERREDETMREREIRLKEAETEVEEMKEKRRLQNSHQSVMNKMKNLLKITSRIEIPVKESFIEIEDDEEEDEEEYLDAEQNGADDFHELSSEQEAKVNYILSSPNSSKVVVEGFRLQITHKDLATLAGLNWLNDEVINFYMSMLVERSEKNNRLPSVYAFNTFFYPKLLNGGQKSVRRWTKNTNLFQYKIILIPVHLGFHWCLAVIDMRVKEVKYYDSMGGDNKNLHKIITYLADEMKDKQQKDFDTSGWKAINVKDIPQQMNGSDCGMFACKFAEYLSRNAKITFNQSHMPYFRRRMVYEIATKTLL